MPTYGLVVVSCPFRKTKFYSNEICENKEAKPTGFPLHREGHVC